MNKEEILKSAKCCSIIASDISVNECGTDIFDFATDVRRKVLAELKAHAELNKASPEVVDFINCQLADYYWENSVEGIEYV